MSNQIYAVGNVGTVEPLRYVPVKAEQRAVLNFSFLVDDYRRTENGEFEQTNRSFWIRATLWGQKATLAAQHLKKGVRVCVPGMIYKGRDWIDEHGERREGGMEMDADDVFISLSRVDSITWRPSRNQAGHSADAGDIPDYLHDSMSETSF